MGFHVCLGLTSHNVILAISSHFGLGNTHTHTHFTSKVESRAPTLLIGIGVSSLGEWGTLWLGYEIEWLMTSLLPGLIFPRDTHTHYIYIVLIPHCLTATSASLKWRSKQTTSIIDVCQVSARCFLTEESSHRSLGKWDTLKCKNDTWVSTRSCYPFHYFCCEEKLKSNMFKLFKL